MEEEKEKTKRIMERDQQLTKELELLKTSRAAEIRETGAEKDSTILKLQSRV